MPVNGTDMAAVFVPGYGVFVCGGEGEDGFIKNCFYNNLDNPAGHWMIMPLPYELRETGISASTLLLYKCNDRGLGLWLIGGKISENDISADSYLYFPSEGANAKWEKFLEFPGSDIPAAVTLDISNIRSVNTEMHLIRVHPDSYACYCPQDVTPCTHGEMVCTQYEDFTSGYTDSYTTATIVDSNGQIFEVAVYKNSGSEDYMLYPKTFANGVPEFEFIPNDLAFNFHSGAMANLNGKALHFGGKAEPGGPWMSQVFAMDAFDFSWRPTAGGGMTRERKDPVVVSVHENWLCKNKK